MCLMLYMATSADRPVAPSPDLRVEPVAPRGASVVQWFSLPVVRFVGAHTGCSCGFPSVIAEQPIDYYDGMPLGGDDRDADLRSVRALLALLRAHLDAGGEVQLYPVADGDEGLTPKGTIAVDASTIVAEAFFFNERFLYRVTRSAV